jgi:prevent-host-death family protein
MPQVGAYEAKTHLPRLLARVQQGERFLITKHGHPVAELVPVTSRSEEAIRHAIEHLERFRAGHSLGGTTVRELIDEGRR